MAVRTRWPSALPEWLGTWASTWGQGLPDFPDSRWILADPEIDSVIEKILANPEIAGALNREYGRLHKKYPKGAERRLTDFLVSIAQHQASESGVADLGRAAKEKHFRDVANKSRMLAKTIRKTAPHSPGSDVIDFLLVKSKNRSYVWRPRDYELGLPGNAFLADCLDAYANDLMQQIPEPKTGRVRRVGGDHSVRNRLIDRLIEYAWLDFGHLPYALLASIATELNDADVDEASVRSRAPLQIRKKALQSSR